MPTILLADDSITIQKIVNLTFSGEGIDVVTVGNGEAAVKKLHELRPALVLADIFMPGKNGYEVCDYIKNDPSLNATPVILLVGAFEPFDSNEAARVKADGHLTKPFEIKVLISAVNSLISAANEQKEAAEPAPELPGPEVADSPVAAEPALNTFAPLPDMPAASRSAWEAEIQVELPSPEPVSAGVSTPVALGVDTEDAEQLAPASIEPVAEPLALVEAVAEEESETQTAEQFPMIEESDPLGLLAVDAVFGTGSRREIALDARSMVVDIWEPRLAPETPAAAVAEEPAIVPVEGSGPEVVDVVAAVQEFDVAQPVMPESTLEEPQFEHPASQAVTATETELPTAQPASEPTHVPALVSEELIERIANRVVEKLSREVIERIAWEVVPDLAELMIKEHVEAQLKESHHS